MKLLKLAIGAVALVACASAVAAPKIAPPSAEQNEVYHGFVKKFKDGQSCYLGVASAQMTYGFISNLSQTGWANFVTTKAYAKDGDDLLYRVAFDVTTKEDYLKNLGISKDDYIKFLKAIAAHDAYQAGLAADGYDFMTGYTALFDDQFYFCVEEHKVKGLDEDSSFEIMDEVSVNAKGQDLGWDEFNPYLKEEKKAFDYDGQFRKFGAR